jgi:hypothetical protein
MRASVLLLLLALGVAAPAAAQPLSPDVRLSQMEARWKAQAEIDRQRGVAQHNELMSLDARIRTEQTLSGLQLRPNLPRGPDPTYTQGAAIPIPSGGGGASGIVSIPDAALAQSNARVQAAADNRN